jgi:hypothetical protein
MDDPGSFVTDGMFYMIGKTIKSIFTSNKWHLCSTSEREVTDILVEGVQAIMELRRIKNKNVQILHKCNL